MHLPRKAFRLDEVRMLDVKCLLSPYYTESQSLVSLCLNGVGTMCSRVRLDSFNGVVAGGFYLELVQSLAPFLQITHITRTLDTAQV